MADDPSNIAYIPSARTSTEKLTTSESTASLGRRPSGLFLAVPACEEPASNHESDNRRRELFTINAKGNVVSVPKGAMGRRSSREDTPKFSAGPDDRPVGSASDNDLCDLIRPAEAHIMVLYTGGTIGMRSVKGAYEPVARYLPAHIRKVPHIHDQEYVDKYYEGCSFPPNVLPRVKDNDRRIIYWVYEYDPLLDSSDMTASDWIRIANDILDNYERFDGFVVLHGTDTMAYTASALSFLFEHLGKPIVLTGSQIPLCEVRSDGRENFIGALIVAGHLDIPEVSLFFNSKVFRGNRSTKMDNASLEAFQSPNLDPLAEFGIGITVDWENVYRSTALTKCLVYQKLCRDVVPLHFYPSISIDYVRNCLKPPAKGIVLQSFGSGNVPIQRGDILAALKEANDRGVIILNCSQCPKGSVAAHYKTGSVLKEAGVIPGGDMTYEAGLTKLAYVLGRDDWDLDRKKKMLGRNIRGEMTEVYDPSKRPVTTRENEGEMSSINSRFLKSFAKLMKSDERSAEEVRLLRQTLLPVIVCQAAADDRLERLQEIKTHLGATMSESDYEGRTPLHVAAACGHVDVLKYLLECGCNIHSRDKFNNTPLLNAVRNKHTECINILVTSGAHLHLPRVALGMELCVDAYQGDVERLRAFKLAGAALDTGDYDHRTALHIAAARGKRDVVEFLLQEGDVDSTLVDSFGRTATKEAEKYEQTEIVELLKSHSEKVSIY